MISQLTICGVTSFKGRVEGNDHDFTKCLVLMPFSQSKKETKVGFDAINAPYGKSDAFKKFDGRTFPIVAECEYDVTTDGIELLSVKFPVANQPQAPKP